MATMKSSLAVRSQKTPTGICTMPIKGLMTATNEGSNEGYLEMNPDNGESDDGILPMDYGTQV